LAALSQEKGKKGTLTEKKKSEFSLREKRGWKKKNITPQDLLCNVVRGKGAYKGGIGTKRTCGRSTLLGLLRRGALLFPRSERGLKGSKG